MIGVFIQHRAFELFIENIFIKIQMNFMSVNNDDHFYDQWKSRELPTPMMMLHMWNAFDITAYNYDCYSVDDRRVILSYMKWCDATYGTDFA